MKRHAESTTFFMEKQRLVGWPCLSSVFSLSCYSPWLLLQLRAMRRRRTPCYNSLLGYHMMVVLPCPGGTAQTAASGKASLAMEVEQLWRWL
jgi:hypothetical protein